MDLLLVKLLFMFTSSKDRVQVLGSISYASIHHRKCKSSASLSVCNIAMFATSPFLNRELFENL